MADDPQTGATQSEWRGKPGTGFGAYTLIAACALIIAYPLLVHGPSCGHDFDFHLQSWLAVAADWHAGLWSPRWISGANYGAGEPRFLFYPPASWILGALLGLALPWSIVPAGFTFVALFSAGCTARAMAMRWMAAPAATLAGCLYLVNPYLLFTGFERAAYGELLAAAWMPLVLLYALDLGEARSGWGRTSARLALAVAALWLTNAPAAVMGCYAAIFCSALGALRPGAHRRRRVPAVLGGVGLGTLLAAVYVVPAWYEQRWVQITRATASGMRIEDSFLFGHTGEPFHDQVLRTASWLAVEILAAAAVGAIVAFAGAAAGASGVWRGPARRERWPSTPPPMVALVALSAAILGMLLPVSAPLWNHLPELRFLQFPWRWLLLAGLAAAVLLGMAVRPGWRWRPMVAVLVLCAFGSSIWASRQFRQFCDEEDNVRAQLQIGEAGFEGTDEYTAGTADNGEIQKGLPPVRLLRAPDADEGDDTREPNPSWEPGQTMPGQVAVEHWGVDRKQVQVVAPEPEYAVLRLEAYPAWVVRVNGTPCGTRCVAREDGLVTIAIPPGRTTIVAEYETTSDVWVGRGVSFAALLVLLAIGRHSRESYHKDDGSPVPL